MSSLPFLGNHLPFPSSSRSFFQPASVTHDLENSNPDSPDFGGPFPFHSPLFYQDSDYRSPYAPDAASPGIPTAENQLPGISTSRQADHLSLPSLASVCERSLARPEPGSPVPQANNESRFVATLLTAAPDFSPPISNASSDENSTRIHFQAAADHTNPSTGNHIHSFYSFIPTSTFSTSSTHAANAFSLHQQDKPLIKSDHLVTRDDKSFSNLAQNMPAPRKRAAPATVEDSSPLVVPRQITKRRRKSQSISTPTQRKRSGPSTRLDDPLFGSAEKTNLSNIEDDDDDSDVIDLCDAVAVPENIGLKPKPPRPNAVKLARFQCVICMDDVTGLTVTHCGHLFCLDCLKSALNIENQKNKCPICRQKIETKSRSNPARTKGFWPLELKLMTANRQGKRAQ